MKKPTIQISSKTSKKASVQTSSSCLTLEYELAELPGSQYRAGLASLILLTRWMAKKGLSKGCCHFSTIKPDRAMLQLDEEGLTALFDVAFAATLQPQKEKGGELPKPDGAFLADYDSCEEEPRWLSLWQNAVIRILRRIPSSQLPFLHRAKREPTKDAYVCWKKIKANKTEQLSGTYLLGAQAQNPEQKEFRATSRLKLLLYFWPFVIWIYRLVAISRDDQLTRGDYVIGIPDVTNLQIFCKQFPLIFQKRDDTKVGKNILRESLVTLSAEAGIHAVSKFHQGFPIQGGTATAQEAISGIDIFQVAGRKYGIHIKKIARQASNEPSLVESYETLRHQCSNYIFRREQLKSLIDDQPFWINVSQLMQCAPKATTFDSYSFSKDSQTLFAQFIKEDTKMKPKQKNKVAEVRRPDSREKTIQKETPLDETVTNSALTDAIGGETAKEKLKRTPSETIEAAVYNLVRTYLAKRVATQYSHSWEEIKGNSELMAKYWGKRHAIASRLFYDVRRRRHNQDFILFLTSTLCSISQQINEQEFILIAQSLFHETEKVRALLLLALSAQR